MAHIADLIKYTFIIKRRKSEEHIKRNFISGKTVPSLQDPVARGRERQRGGTVSMKETVGKEGQQESLIGRAQV